MREWGSVLPDGDLLLLGRHRCRLLAEVTGVDKQPIWEWGMIQCVSNGLLLEKIGFHDPASVEFAMAEAWAPHERTHATYPPRTLPGRRPPVKKCALPSGGSAGVCIHRSCWLSYRLSKGATSVSRRLGMAARPI